MTMDMTMIETKMQTMLEARASTLHTYGVDARGIAHPSEHVREVHLHLWRLFQVEACA